MKRRLLRIASLAALSAGLTSPLAAAPKAELWPLWQHHRPESTATVDHGPWQAFLDRYVSSGTSGIHLVAYAAVTASDRQALGRYLTSLEATRVSALNRREQLAYWINLYNAATLKVVLDHMPVDSITDIDISPGFFSNGPWGAKLLRVEGRELSLNDVEHRILRPIWRDPRIHYAVNCASLGCPNLGRQAYTAETAEELLEAAARDYVNHPRGARFDGEKLVVSSIFVWYRDDFGGSDAGVVESLRRYATPELARRLQSWDGGLDHDYDWSLNAAGD